MIPITISVKPGEVTRAEEREIEREVKSIAGIAMSDGEFND